MNLFKTKFFAVLAAILCIIAAVAAIYFAIVLTNGPSVAESARFKEVISAPMQPALSSENNDIPLGAKPFADRVALAVIPDRTHVASAQLTRFADKPTKNTPPPPPRFPELVRLGATRQPNPVPAAAAAIVTAQSGPPAAGTVSLFAPPHLAQVSTAIVSPNLPRATPAAVGLDEPSDLPAEVDAGAQHRLTDLDIALHPSLKYGSWVAAAGIARSASEAAFEVPIAAVGKKATKLAQSLQSAAKPEAVAQAAEDKQALIDANLKMEQARRFVMSMCTDKQGRLWVATEPDSENPDDGGVQCFDPAAPPLHQWTQFTTKNGLGDNYGYAIACDRLGRVWVGHLNHGVSVFNGERWQVYEEASGLSRPGTLSGPVGERVFAIAICPTDGDVWIATNAGLTRYSEKRDNWKYYTQADGLPSDQLQAIAFDPSGNIIVGTQCEGLALASNADDYHRWQTIRAANASEASSDKNAFPCNLINDVAITTDETIWVATTNGLARSADNGASWTAYTDPNIPQASEAKERPRPTQQTRLRDSYCSCLAPMDGGRLWVGYRGANCDLFDNKMGRLASGPNCYATSIKRLFGQVVVASYGEGLSLFNTRQSSRASELFVTLAKTPALPKSAAPPTVAELQDLLTRFSKPSVVDEPARKVVVLPDDWRTRGAWMGRYGRYTGIFAAMSNPGDYVWGAGAEPASYEVKIGPSHLETDSIRYWRHWLYTTNPKSLELPPVYLDSRIAHGWTTPGVNRRQSEWDDHGEAYSRRQDGPDVLCDLHVPSGRFRLSLYDFNKDGHDGPNAFRDYEVNIWDHSAGTTDLPTPDVGRLLAHSRISHFWGGVYKVFAVQGPIDLTIQLRRNHSFNTILAGVMLDSFDERPAPYFAERESSPTVPVDTSGLDEVDHRSCGQLQRDDLALASLPQNRIYAALLLRHLLAEQDSMPEPGRSVALGACYFVLNECAKWEDCQREQRLVPARDIEKALTWDQSIPAYSGRGHQTVVEYLAAHPEINSRSFPAVR
jgi:hypothetical protein